MKRFLSLGLAMLLAAASLAACRSAPIHYYTLQAPSPATAKGAITQAPFLIDVLPVGIPAQLDQSSLVVRQGDNGIVLPEGERWASPYGDELRNALSAALSRSLDTADVAGLALSRGPSIVRIKVQIRSVDAWLGQRVQVDADWSLGRVGNKEGGARTCHGQFATSAGGGYPELVIAQQQVVDMLAARIAADVRKLDHPRTTDCKDSDTKPAP